MVPNDNVIPFPASLTGVSSRSREALQGAPETRPAGADEQLLGSLAGLFRAAGCPGLAEAFGIEAGGRCG